MNDLFYRGSPVLVDKKLIVPSGNNKRAPLLTGLTRHIETKIKINRDESRNILCPFNVSTHPVNRIGDAAEHGIVGGLKDWFPGILGNSTQAKGFA